VSSRDTIAAIATASGPGAIGIVRLSGPNAGAIAERVIGGLPPPRHAALKTVRNSSGQIIDQAIAIYYPGPNSYSGEDILEIQTHGGAIPARQTLVACLDAGARAAEPGEFTQRAFLNGKLDLLQAEAVADLIESTSLRAARLAQNSLTGRFSEQVTSISKALKSVRVQLEATIDFPDEDLPETILHTLSTTVAHLTEELRRLQASASRGERLNSGLDIAIAGRPNVGKSTLLNALAEQDRAIVDPTPGTTRDVLSVDINLEGLTLRIHDTAGLRETDDAIEREGVRRARAEFDKADAIFFLCTDEAEAAADILGVRSQPVFIIRNKIDLDGVPPLSKPHALGTYLQLSAKTGAGLDLLRKAVAATFDLDGEDDNVVLARDRHLRALDRAREALAFDPAQLFVEAPELGAERLRIASRELDTMTGAFTTEDLLGEIFSTFCIGK